MRRVRLTKSGIVRSFVQLHSDAQLRAAIENQDVMTRPNLPQPALEQLPLVLGHLQRRLDDDHVATVQLRPRDAREPDQLPLHYCTAALERLRRRTAGGASSSSIAVANNSPCSASNVR